MSLRCLNIQGRGQHNGGANMDSISRKNGGYVAETFRQYQERVRKLNPRREKDKEKCRDYHRRNKDRKNIHALNCRARRAGVEGTLTLEGWRKVKEFFNYTCLRCGKREPEIKLTPDHVMPIAKHGSNTIDNIQPLCGSCNSSKGGRQKIDYRPIIPFV
jgi:5-methylcytosine-specific restriction endonuclease McrA